MSTLPTQRTVYRRTPTGDSAGSYTLAQSTEPLPNPLPATALLLKVHAVALNYRDMNMLRGNNPWPIIPHGIPAADMVGTVLAAGRECTRFGAGARVSPITDRANITGDEQARCWAAGDVDGVLASHVVVDEAVCVGAPAALSHAEAALLPCAGVTAWAALTSHSGGALRAGQSVLLQGTGGVSMLALKFAAAAGCALFVSSASDAKLGRVARIAGRAVHGLNYARTHDWDQAVRRANGGRGVDVVLENGGTASMLRSVRAARKSGTVALVGYLGPQDATDLEGLLPLLIDTDVALNGINCGSRRDFEAMNRFIEASGLRFEDVVYQRFGFGMEGVLGAYECLRGAGHIGKVVIDVD